MNIMKTMKDFRCIDNTNLLQLGIYFFFFAYNIQKFLDLNQGKLKIESVDINTLNKNINNKDDLILLLPLINRCKANLKINLLLT